MFLALSDVIDTFVVAGKEHFFFIKTIIRILLSKNKTFSYV